MKDFEFFKLEDRVLFEAAAAAEIVEAADNAEPDPNAEVGESGSKAQSERDALKNAPPENPAENAAAQNACANGEPADNADVDAEIAAVINGEIPAEMVENLASKELVVINDSVADKDTLISSLKPHQEVLVLKDGTGLAELTEFLNESDMEYSAIHFVTHGNDGYISVNGERIDAENFDAAVWQEIGEYLSEDGDILLYGCDTAANAQGKMLVDLIADASGADVAASDDTTGFGGDWDLEYAAGSIGAAEIKVDGFDGHLKNITVDTADDVVDGSDGFTSLREAITEANGTPGADVIEFADTLDGKTIKLDNGALEITDSVTISGNGAADTVIDGNGADGIFNAMVFDDIEISFNDLTLQNGSELADGVSNGGAIYASSLFGDVTMSLENVTVTGCSAKDGGAIYIDSLGAVSLDVVNTTLFNNSAVGHGGAIAILADSFTVNVVNSTVTGNAGSGSGSGAGLFLNHNSDSEVNLLNSIVYGNGSGDDIYVENADPAVNVKLGVIHTVYGGISDGYNGETFTPTSKVESTELEFSDANTEKIFGTASPTLKDGVIQVDNQEIAGYGGTLVGKDAAGNFVYMSVADGSWKDLSGNAASMAETIDTDEIGNSRTMAQDVLGVNEFFIGAASGKVFLSVATEDAEFKYDGKEKSAELIYTTAKGTEVDVTDLPDKSEITPAEMTTDSADEGTYTLDPDTITITLNDTDVKDNFEIDASEATITIKPKGGGGGDDGPPAPPSDEKEVVINGIIDSSDDIDGNVYTMNYSQLVAYTMLNPSRVTMESVYQSDSLVLPPINGTVSVDVLKYAPMTIDAIMRDSAVISRGQVVNVEGMISGQEIFTVNSSDSLLKAVGDGAKEPPETLYDEGGLPDLPTDNHSAAEFAALDIVELPLPPAMPAKAEAFKSGVEKLLDELELG